jgi:hypothetical protein
MQLAFHYKQPMKRKKPKLHIMDSTDNGLFPGYPLYPANEDIYINDSKVSGIDFEDANKKLQSAEEEFDAYNRNDFGGNEMGGDLDVPGAELDDAMEAIGSEDEENNYYSLSGEDPNELDENKGL